MGGAIIASAGFAVSSFAVSVEYLFVSFSLMVGFGLGITYIPAIVAVSDFFNYRRPFAIGVAVSGVGFGMLIYPPINK